jgi:polyhydroxybutyrate depolymerase
LAAIAPVAGVNAAPVCPRGTPPVSVLAFHGTADLIVPYPGGALLGGTLPVLGTLKAQPVDDAVARWAAFDGCVEDATETRVAADVQQVSYTGCRRDRSVELVRVVDGGHTWPGAFPIDGGTLGVTTQSVSATAEMLDFFDAHPRAR